MAAHFLIFPDGTAERLHGHNYKVYVEVKSGLDQHGLVLNFKDVKPRVRALVDELDEYLLLPGEHPIVPVMLGEAQLAQDLAARLFEEGVYVSGFFFPVVPRGQARIRTQMNAALTREDLDTALSAFERAGRSVGVIG